VKRTALALLLAAACSGALEGEPATAPVADWSFVSGAEDVALATQGGRRFRSVVATPLVHEGDLYLHVSTLFSLDDGALEELLAGGGLVLRAGGRLYDLRAIRLTDAREIERILPTLVREEMNVEASGLRWDPQPARYPGTQLRQWFFRLEGAP